MEKCPECCGFGKSIESIHLPGDGRCWRCDGTGEIKVKRTNKEKKGELNVKEKSN